jgi:hypothetical protein
VNCKSEINLSEADLRFDYLDKLNFARCLLLDLFPEDEKVKSKMESLHSTLEQLVQLLSGIEEVLYDLSQARQLIENGDDILKFIYFATEDEIYLKIKGKFSLTPEYSWHLYDKIYNKLNSVSQKINYLSEITIDDVSDIQKSLMQIAIIFNTNLDKEGNKDQYLIRHLNAVYHYVRGDFNESLYFKGEMKEKIEWDTLQKAKIEYKRALECDENLSKAEKRLTKIEKMIV